MQIGRQCTFLSEEFKANYNKIGWNDLIDLSNIIFTDFLSLNIQNLGKISRHNIFKINKIIKDSESINIFEFE
jgi:uncharacterized protein with HEPN domain